MHSYREIKYWFISREDYQYLLQITESYVLLRHLLPIGSPFNFHLHVSVILLGRTWKSFSAIKLFWMAESRVFKILCFFMNNFLFYNIGNANKTKYSSRLEILTLIAKTHVKLIQCVVRLKYPRSILKFVECAMHLAKIVSRMKVQNLLDLVIFTKNIQSLTNIANNHDFTKIDFK